ncbi:MAG: hypothetical protein IPG96_16210 [Proteobacteria bacterium]|nr:hypothetical protein [Pseudomonadota bacterium]
MNVKDLISGKYLSAKDMVGQRVLATLDICQIEEFENKNTGGTDSRPVVYFEDLDQGMVLNKTNLKVLAREFGEETSAWKGKRVLVTTHKVKTPAGAEVDGLRIEPWAEPVAAAPRAARRGTPAPAPTPTQAVTPREDLSQTDNIPF